MMLPTGTLRSPPLSAAPLTVRDARWGNIVAPDHPANIGSRDRAGCSGESRHTTGVLAAHAICLAHSPGRRARLNLHGAVLQPAI
jgi:hypothetical protein